MSTNTPEQDSPLYNEFGYIFAGKGAAVIGATVRDCPKIAPSGASIVWFEQMQKHLVPLLVANMVLLAGVGIVMGFNLSRQHSIEQALRDDQVAQDLRKYETQQLRVQAALNAELQKLILQRGCKP